MSRLALLPVMLIGLAVCVEAGVIKGMVLEQESGLPLARTRVRLHQIRANGVVELKSVFAGSSGQFAFESLDRGAYLVSATRDGYLAAYWGQKRPDSLGMPIEVTDDSSTFAEMRLYRLGAITGRVLDENRIGIAGVTVHAYPAKTPLRTISSAKSDDRGQFRIYGLPPGKYLIRSDAHTLEDGSGVVPTFSPETLIRREAREIAAALNTDTNYTDVRPIPGRLITVRGSLICPGGMAVTVVLATETGRREVKSSCMATFEFAGVAPGRMEILAVTADGTRAAWDDRGSGGTLQLDEVDRVNIEVKPVADVPVTLRRRDPSGVESAREVRRGDRLIPGCYEATANPAANQFLERIEIANYRFRPDSETHPDWYLVCLPPGRAFRPISVQLGTPAGSMSGQVTHEGSPVAGVLVFLWPVKPETRRSIGGPRQVQTGSDGRFQFTGLAPGAYRVIASYELTQIDENTVETLPTESVTIGPGDGATVSLSLYRIP